MKNPKLVICPECLSERYPVQMALIVDELMQKYGVGGIIEKAFKFTPLWNVNNGRTLCAQCHSATLSYGKNINHKSINKSDPTFSV